MYTSIPTQDERNLAMLCHLSAFGGFIIPLANILIPLVIWLMKRDTSAFINHQAKEVLNFQITITVIILVLTLLFFTIIGSLPAIIGLVGIGFIDIIFPIIGAIKANEGEFYRYPLTQAFVK